jgi:glycyl-tRNA synthetase beta chain
MSQLLFEIGVEDLPALSIDQACLFMKDFMEEELKNLRLTHKGIKTLGTPRRLVLMIDGLAEKQPDHEEEVLGPSTSIAYGAQGLSKAGAGFIKSKGLLEKDIYKKSTEKGEIIAGMKLLVGEKTANILPQVLVSMLRKMPFKKRMRWNSSNESFARPVVWLLALLSGKVLPVNFAGVSSADESRGHRFMNHEIFKVSSTEQYLREMKERFVILSSEERKEMFIKSAGDKLKSLNSKFVYDEDLMETVKNLVEYPFVILGRFPDKYLKIPSEILVCEMKAHQKCFAVYDQQGNILPYFICSAGTRPYDEMVFAQGNERVLRARFEDGAFYYDLDTKKKLSEHGSLLSSLIFERELGTVLDKSLRIEKLGLALAKAFGLSELETKTIKESSPLLKADLTSGVVGQFPELQGVMGRIYAKNDGYGEDICEIIETHYWPRFAEDKLPRLKTAAVLSIADRLDTLLGIIAIGKKPVGNKDPFALRRAGIGIVRLIIVFGFSIDIKELLALAAAALGPLKNPNALAEAEEFLLQRARGVLIEELSKDCPQDAVNFADSAIASGSLDLLDIFARAHTLSSIKQKSPNEFLTLVQAFKRASNIVKKAEGLVLDQSLRSKLNMPVEVDLLSAVDEVRSRMKKDIDRSSFNALCLSYNEMFSLVALIKPKLDAFFDNVMVMVDDDQLKKARLSLLSDIKHLADKIGDFTHL